MNDKPIYLSKRFISALVGLVLMVVIAYVPDLKPYEPALIEGVSQVVMALIAGYSLTDIARDYLAK